MSPAALEKLRALVGLAVRATGASGGAIRVQSDGTEVEFGKLDGGVETIRLAGGSNAVLGHLDLASPGSTDGIAALVSPLFTELMRGSGPRGAGLRAVEDMRGKVSDLERELHHRTGNVLQTVASFLRMQCEDFENRPGATVQDARMLVEEARIRVLAIGAVQSAMEIAARDDDEIEVDILIDTLSERLAEILPGHVEFETDLAGLTLSRGRASPIGLIIAEFALAAIRDAFPKPACHRLLVRTAVAAEDGHDSVSVILHHEATGYDMGGWSHGSPALTGRIVEAVAAQMDGLVAIDRSNDDGDGPGGTAPGLRLRLVFDRPVADRPTRTSGDENSGHIPGPPRTFDNRLGVRTGAPAHRKS